MHDGISNILEVSELGGYPSPIAEEGRKVLVPIATLQDYVVVVGEIHVGERALSSSHPRVYGFSPLPSLVRSTSYIRRDALGPPPAPSRGESACDTKSQSDLHARDYFCRHLHVRNAALGKIDRHVFVRHRVEANDLVQSPRQRPGSCTWRIQFANLPELPHKQVAVAAGCQGSQWCGQRLERCFDFRC